MLGTYLFAAHGVLLLEGALLLGGSVGAFLGGTEMIASGILVTVLWLAMGVFTLISLPVTYRVFQNASADPTAALWWANRLLVGGALLSALTGMGLGFLAFASCGPLFVAPLYHWTGLAGTLLLLPAYFCLPLVVPPGARPVSRPWWMYLALPGPVVVLWSLMWIILWAFLHGSVNPTQYPSQSASPYKLPFPSGEDSWVIQGNNTAWDHQGTQAFAWDFRRRCGTPVLAARAGTVIQVVDTNDGHGSNSPNNLIVIQHSDGSQAQYLHIQKGSVPAKLKPNPGKKGLPSPTVVQGEVLAQVGNVGNSLTGHIHFEVTNSGGKQSIPVTFKEVTQDNGIPRTWSTYVSANPK
jgi:hypothetical protein